mmetsp:Transcript_15791/g.48980  ORF Transcript_15791/g.48980 Transcript_15791/m.48980 type:complete len:643 (-) Transcript_15791:265-2193(-)
MRALLALRTCAVVVLATCAAVAAAQSSAGDMYGLHPTCGAIRRSTISQEITELTSQNSTELEVSCFSYSLQPVGMDSGSCAAAPPNRVVLDITDPANPDQGQSVDFSGIYRGSMYATAFRFNTLRTFRLYLHYPDYRRCPRVMYVSLYAELTVRRRTAVEHPFVVSAQPIVMYHGEPYTVHLRNPVPVAAAQRNSIRAVLIHDTKRCSRDAATEYRRGGGHRNALVWVNSTDAMWPVQAPEAGGFAICISSGSDNWSMAAFVEAYGGTPAFFDASEVQLSGRTRGRSSYDFVFFGQGLNAARDSLVFVSSSYHSCGATPRASSSVAVEALTQRSSNSTSARVTFSSRNRLFLVCYRVAGAATYVDVPNFDTMSRHVIENVTDAGQQQANHENAHWSSGVAPVTPGSSDDDPTAQWLTSCATAPVQPAYDRVTTDVLVRLVLSDSSLPGDFTQTIANVLCLPGPRNVSIAEVTGSTALRSGLDVFVAINCPANVCNSAERQQALIAAGQSRRIAGVVTASAYEFDGVSVRAASADSGSGDGKGSDTLYVVVGVLVALVIVLLVVVVLVFRYRGRAAARAALPDADVIQGHVVEVQGAPADDRRAAPGTDNDPYHAEGTVVNVQPQRDADDTAPIPPPPAKPTS